MSRIAEFETLSAKIRRERMKRPFAARKIDRDGNEFTVMEKILYQGEDEGDIKERWKLWRGFKTYQAASFFRSLLPKDIRFKLSVLQVSQERGGCWCAPKPCHGDILIKLSEEDIEHG